MNSLKIKNCFSLQGIFILVLCCVNGFCFSQCTATINSFPYTEDFETSQGNWASGGTGNDWAWGTPSKPVISSAGSGVKCWITGGLTTSYYNTSERSYVQSPCFDFSTLVNPFITFKVFWETERQYDGGNLQYSINGGTSWNNVGSYNGTIDCLNNMGYNNPSITNLTGLATTKAGWSGNIQATMGSCQGGSGSNMWQVAKQAMPYLAGQPQVIFRFTFGAGTTCNDYDGLAFDDILIEEAPVTFTLSYTSKPAGCNIADGSANVQVNGGNAPYTYSWSPNVSSNAIAVHLNSGNYTVTVTDANNCKQSVLLSVAQSPAVSFSLTTLSDTCSQQVGAAITQVTGGTAPFTYAWTNGDTTANAYYLLHGSYAVTVTDSQNCKQSKSFVIGEVGDFTIDLGEDKFVCGNFALLLDPGPFAVYHWQDASATATYTATAIGTYAVTVTNNFGCLASDTVVIREDCVGGVFVPKAFTPNGDLLNDQFLAIGQNIQSFSMMIYDRWGQPVFESNNISKGWNGRFNNQPMPKGLYVWQINFSKPNSDAKTIQGIVFLIR